MNFILRLENALRSIHNMTERDLFQNKLAFKTRLEQQGFRVPQTYLFFREFHEFDEKMKNLEGLDEFVVKPNHLSRGRYIRVIRKVDGKFTEPDGSPMSLDDLMRDAKIFMFYKKGLHGFFSGLLVEELLHTHATLKSIYKIDGGIADVRFYMMDDDIAFGRLRMPTKDSGYYSNWARGAATISFNKEGIFFDGSPYITNSVVSHPDSGVNLLGKKIPFYETMLSVARNVAGIFQSRYHTVDMTVNAEGEVVVIEGETHPTMNVFSERGAMDLIQMFKTGEKPDWG